MDEILYLHEISFLKITNFIGTFKNGDFRYFIEAHTRKCILFFEIYEN